MKKIFSIMAICLLCMSFNSNAEAFFEKKGYGFFSEVEMLVDVRDYEEGEDKARGYGTRAYQIFWNKEDGILFFSVHGYRGGKVYDSWTSVPDYVDNVIKKHNLFYLKDKVNYLVIACCHPSRVEYDMNPEIHSTGNWHSKLFDKRIFILGARFGFEEVLMEGLHKNGTNGYHGTTDNTWLISWIFPYNKHNENVILQDKDVVLPDWCRKSVKRVIGIAKPRNWQNWDYVYN